MNSREVIPTGAILTKNGDIVDQHGSLLNVDIYGSSNEEIFLPKTVAIIVTYNPGLGNFAGKLCAINLEKHQHETRFFTIEVISQILFFVLLLIPILFANQYKLFICIRKRTNKYTKSSIFNVSGNITSSCEEKGFKIHCS